MTNVAGQPKRDLPRDFNIAGRTFAVISRTTCPSLLDDLVGQQRLPHNLGEPTTEKLQSTVQKDTYNVQREGSDLSVRVGYRSRDATIRLLLRGHEYGGCPKQGGFVLLAFK